MQLNRQNKVQLLNESLMQAVDINNNVIDEAKVLEIINELESTALTTEDLRATRIGRRINEIRRKTSNTEISRRAKELVKAWRGYVNEAIKQDSQLESTTIKFNDGDTLSHSLNMKDTIVNDNNGLSMIKQPMSQGRRTSVEDNKTAQAVDKKNPPLPKLVLLINRNADGTTIECTTRQASSQSVQVPSPVIRDHQPPSVITSGVSSVVKPPSTRPSKVATTLDLLTKIQADQSCFKEAYEISRKVAEQKLKAMKNDNHKETKKRMQRTRRSKTAQVTNSTSSSRTRSFDDRDEDNLLTKKKIQRTNKYTKKRQYKKITIETSMQNESKPDVLSSNSTQEELPQLAEKSVDKEVAANNYSSSDDSYISISEARFTLCPDEDLVSNNMLDDFEWRTESTDINKLNDFSKRKTESAEPDFYSTLIRPSIFGGEKDPAYDRIMRDFKKDTEQQKISSSDGININNGNQEHNLNIDNYCYIKILPYLPYSQLQPHDDLAEICDQMDEFIKLMSEKKDDSDNSSKK